jgi:DNA-binding protein Fis
MITNKDINEEITAIEDSVEAGKIKDVYQVAMIKLETLKLKMLMSMRTNQTSMMDKMGVKKIEPQIRREGQEK